MTPFLHGGMAFRAAEMGFLRRGNGLRATDLGFLRGVDDSRATELPLLRGARVVRAAKCPPWRNGISGDGFVLALWRGRVWAAETCGRCGD